MPLEPTSRGDQNTAGSFSCFLCDATEFSAAGMEHHIQLFHSDGSDSLTKCNYSCPFCAFSTSCETDLQSHVDTEHSEQHAGQLCESTFMCAEDVENHMAESHAEDVQTSEKSEETFVKNVIAEDITVAERDIQDEHSKPRAIKQEEPCSSGSMNVTAEVAETSLRLNDCPADDALDYDHENDEMNDFDDVDEDMDADKKLTSVFGDVPDDESNLLLILGSTQNRNNTPKHVTSHCSDAAMRVSEGSHRGARPKSITRKPAGSSTNDLTETQPSSSPEDINKYAHDTDQKGNAAIVSSKVDSGPSFSCPLCSFQTTSECEIQCHVVQEHEMEEGDNSADWDMTSSVILFSCPFCANGFDLPSDLSQHINTMHPDGEVGGGSSSHAWSDVGGSEGNGQPSARLQCPVCGFVLKDGNEALLSAHVSDHFASSSTTQAQADRDCQLAMRLQSQENKQRQEDDKKFQKLQTHYGMDNSMTAKQQFEQDLEQAVSKGKITTRQFHQKKVIQAQSNRSGVDDGSTQVPGVLERLQRFYDSRSCPRTVIQAYLCTSTHHYSGSYGDKGWGCGYRNFQMMLSCLMNEPRYFQVLFSGQAKMPSIQKLQQLIEKAWQKGFDPQGCQQLGGSVVNTRKWIGATEIVATLSSFRIKCQLLDFGEPSGPDNTHPTMIRWVRDYFKSPSCFKPPLYLQHQGHSRTIVGIEELRNGNTNLLLFDPGVPRARMEQFHGNINYNLLQTVRKTVNAFRAKQYQIVAVVGFLDDREFERSKSLRSTKMS